MKKLLMPIFVQLSLPIVAAMTCYLHMEPSLWIDIKREVMLVLSVMAGAILFRLGRGIPYMEVGELSISEIRKLANAMKTISFRLSYVLAVTSISLIGLALIEIIHRVTQTPQAATAVLAFFIVFSICRAVMVVMGDINFTALQSEIMVQNARRRSAKRKANMVSEKMLKEERENPFRPPSNYGNLID